MSSFELLTGALDFCVHHHRGQYRDGTAAVPYACHPVEVMLTLRNIAQIENETILAAALLHDCIEDTKATIESVEKAFGKRVADLVSQVTRFEPARPPHMTDDEYWKVRTKQLLEEISRMEREALLIKLADRLSNIKESEVTRKGKKRNRYRKQTVWILQAIPRNVEPRLWDLIAAVLKMSAKDISKFPQFLI